MSRPEAATHATLETPIAPLFYAMGSHIPKVLLDRATCPQRRINKHGEIYEVKLHDTGLSQDLINLLDATTLRQSIGSLISLSIISVQESVYICQQESARISFEQSKGYWIHQAFTLCCYVFPRSPMIDPS
jgi:hypothetical protein